MTFRSGLAIVLGLALAACQKGPAPAEGSAAPAADGQAWTKELSVGDVAALVQTKNATVLDANDADTRKEQGVVPGAVLLSSSRDYALSELPPSKDTKLVFYCGGTACRSSDKAAKRAADAGYADVSVMRAGIRGWKSAGQTTATPQS
jgi:rhodanese-related sulfurtransferase